MIKTMLITMCTPAVARCDKTDEWRDLGATHLSVATMGAGLASPDSHLERLREAKAALTA